MVHSYNADGEPSPYTAVLDTLSESPEPETWMGHYDPGGLQVLANKRSHSMSRSPESMSTDYNYASRSPLLEPEHGIHPSGLDRIRQPQPSRVLTLPNLSSASLAPLSPRPTSCSRRSSTSSRTPSILSPNQTSISVEDLHRFPCESLHSFSFAHPSEELLHTRQNILRRSIDFMRDRLGWTASNNVIINTQARAGGESDIQSLPDILSKSNILEKENRPQFAYGRAPITGQADVGGENVFERAFTGPTHSASELEGKPSRRSSSSDLSPPASPLPHDFFEHHKGELRSAPASRRVSLKPQSYAATDTLSITSSTVGLGFQMPALHTHGTKWTPVSQAVFRTESQAPWTILAANDLACLIFGVSQSEVRRLSILDVVQDERREWLEFKLQDHNADTATKFRYPDKSRIKPVSPRFVGLGNGVTAQLLSKPSSREKASRRAQTDDGFGSSTRNPRNPNHSAHKSRGVLMCGDVVPIQKRNGTKGSATVWVMEKRGGFIWVLEEITQNVAQISYDECGRIVDASGQVDDIWGHAVVTPSRPVLDILPHIPKDLLEDRSGQGVGEIADIKYFAARTSTGTCIPTIITKGIGPRCLQVSSYPDVAGMMVVYSSTLNVVSTNSVFSAALFGQERPEGRHITELIPGFDELLHVLTDHDKIPLVDGIVIPEHSFRRARMLSILRDSRADIASIFSEPIGLPAIHRDGSTITVDIQLRVVKSGTLFARDQDAVHEDLKSGIDRGTKDTVSITELMYALWITHSKKIHAAGSAEGSPTPLPKPPKDDTSPQVPASGLQETTDSYAKPASATSGLDISAPEAVDRLESLTKQLSEAASEPLTDRPLQPVREVKLTSSGKEPPHKKTIADFVILEDMGQGAYGQVKLARLKKNSAHKVVLKYVTKSKILVDTWTRDRRLGTVPLEIHVLDFLRRDGLKHPNIVEMEGFFEDDINYYIEMRPHGLPGMDLFDYIELKSNMDESECRNIFRQVADAIHHLHNKALVVHRDIKDENVILDGEGRIKLIDFGSAAYIKNGPFDVFVGTIDYAAPEVLQGKSYRGKEQDVWALGILLYTIVYKENPFYDVEEILDHPLRIPFLPFSEDCIDLIRKMLDRDVDNRLTVTEVLEHPWMTDH